MFTNNLIAGAAGQGGSFYPFAIDQSLRFNDDDSAYLNRTPASAGNRKTWTWSGWVKRGNLGGTQTIFGTGSGAGGSVHTALTFNTSNQLDTGVGVIGVGTIFSQQTNAVFRDTSAWYHIVLVYDTSNATSTDRVRIYVNGERQSVSGSFPSQNYDCGVNTTQQHRIGSFEYAPSNLLDGYLAEVNFIDGQALDPTSFGEFKSGVWVAKEYTGSYGTNGFYLDFANSASLGADTSGNSNNWTPTNLAATDQVLDGPTGNNFCTFNSAIRPYPNSDVLSQGNLRRTNTATGVTGSNWGTFSITSGKWYYETAIETAGALTCWIGWSNNEIFAAGGTYSAAARDKAYMYMSNGNKALDSATGTAYGATYTTGDVIGVALDADNNTITFYKNGVSQGVAFTGISTVGSWIPAVSSDPGWIPVVNFGQDSSFAGNKTAQGNTDANGVGDFYHSVPSGFLALAASNLPNPTIDPAQDDVPEDYFNTVLYTGNGFSTSGTQSITNVGFQPDFTWIKSRSTTGRHSLYDAIRGSGKTLSSDLTDAESTQTDSLTSFDADGFSLGDNSESGANVNVNNTTYAAWNWLAGNGTSSNTSGSITSTVSVNQKAGFSIVSYTGNGTAGATIGHSLGAVPAFIMIKGRTNSDNWMTKHQSYSSNLNFIELNTTNALGSATDVWNNTAPTSTVFSVGTGATVNSNGVTYICYAFAEVESYSKFGSYVGNGSTDGPFIFCGFRPSWVMVKRTDAANMWLMMDDKRYTYNVMGVGLKANAADAEFGWNPSKDFLSNGFKVRTSDAAENASGGTYIYMAFAENPFKYANAR